MILAITNYTQFCNVNLTGADEVFEVSFLLSVKQEAIEDLRGKWFYEDSPEGVFLDQSE
ncbi:MAG: hypothetical protein ACI9E1_000429 [Cryomorphaceae bacterium]|jgi:hypothetical protein